MSDEIYTVVWDGNMGLINSFFSMPIVATDNYRYVYGESVGQRLKLTIIPEYGEGELVSIYVDRGNMLVKKDGRHVTKFRRIDMPNNTTALQWLKQKSKAILTRVTRNANSDK